MSREAYNQVPANNSGTRSPGRSSRRLTELPTVDRSPSRDYGSRGSPLGKNPFFLFSTLECFHFDLIWLVFSIDFQLKIKLNE